MSTIIPRYADPDTVRCPRCDAPPGKPCVSTEANASNGHRLDRFHVARTRVPARYECRVCGGAAIVSLVSGRLVHSAFVSADHTAQVHDDLRRWTP